MTLIELTEADAPYTTTMGKRFSVGLITLHDIYIAGKAAGRAEAIAEAARAARSVDATVIAGFARGGGNVAELAVRQCVAAIEALA